MYQKDTLEQLYVAVIYNWAYLQLDNYKGFPVYLQYWHNFISKVHVYIVKWLIPFPQLSYSLVH